MATFLGIDAGTTNMKAALIDESGNILDIVCSPTAVLTPFEGANEMDMHALWSLLCKLTTRLREKNPAQFDGICGVGITAQGDGMWPLDKDGNPVGNAILWNDTRTRELTGIDNAALDKLLVERSSTALFAGASPLILTWISRNQPERFAKIHRAVRCKDWLNFRLTGRIASDYTDYSTCGINIFTKRHVPEIYDFLGIPQARDMLPELTAPTDIIGTVTPRASGQSGIPAGIPVIAGAIDVVATIFGAGVVQSGDGCAILGTTLCSEILIGAEQVDVTDRSGSALCSILPDKFVRVMAALSGNSTIDWAKSVLAPELSFLQLENELEHIPPGSRGILYHPYICGERAPFRNPFACGGFYGLNSLHTRFDMLRAVYEGMVLSLKDCMNALPRTQGQGKLFLSGGGAVSDFTCGLIANALGKQVVRSNRRELAAQGVVEAIKIGLDMGAKITCAGQTDCFEPNQALYQKYNEIYTQFVSLRQQMEPYWQNREVYQSK